MMNDIAVILIQALWFMLPSLVANPSAVLFGGGTPVDFGKEWNGKRILGDGKTWKGLAGGTGTGIVVGLLLFGISNILDKDYLSFGEFPGIIWIFFLLAFGSMLGDMLGSILKRRLNVERGAKAPILDQYDFIIGTFLLLFIFQFTWAYENYIEGIHILALITLLVATPILHRIVNIIGYKMGKKDVPW